MKKKVLFALIALFSFVSVWAGDAIPKAQKYVPIPKGQTKAVFPVDFIKKGDQNIANYAIYASDRKTQLDRDNITAVGYYFAKVTTGTGASAETYYLPFEVWKEAASSEFEFIYNKTTFDGSVGSGALQLYYEYCIGQAQAAADGRFWGGTKADWEMERDNWYHAASTAADKYSRDQNGFPWIVFKAPTSGSYRVAWTYDDANIADCAPWGARTFGPNEGDKSYGVGSVVEHDAFNQVGWMIGYQAEGEAPEIQYSLVGKNPDPLNRDEGAFDISKFHMYWTPATEADYNYGPLNYAWTLAPASAPYTGDPINVANNITVKAESVDQETGLAETEVVRNGWLAEYFRSGSKVDQVVNAGTYQVKVYLPIEQPGVTPNDATVTKQYIASATDVKDFTVTGKKVIITPSYVYKYYGDPDPEKPNFELATGEAMSDALRDEIKQFVFFKRTAGQTGEDASMYQYYIDVARQDPNNNLDVTVVNNFSYLIIDPLALDVVWADPTKNTKVYGELDPAFDYKLHNSRNKYLKYWPETAGSEFDATTLTAKDKEIYDAEKAAWLSVFPEITITREKADLHTAEGEDVGEYKFIATLSDALKSPYKDGAGNDLWNYQVANAATLGNFTITPYDFAHTVGKTNAQGKFVNAQGDVVELESQAEQLPDPKVEISIKDQTYTGVNQYPSPYAATGQTAQVTVTFDHAVLGENMPLVAGNGKDYEVRNGQKPEGGYANNKDVTRDASNKLAATAQCDIYAATGAKNFINSRTGYFKINPAEVTISFAENFEKVYGGAEPNFISVLQYTGFLNGETVETVEGFSKPTVERVKGEDVGEYAVQINGDAAADNYVFKTVPGKLTITPATLHVTATVTGGKEFGQTPEIVATVTQGDYKLPGNATKADANLLGEFKVDEDGEIVLDDDNKPVSYGPIPALCSTIVTTTNGVTTWSVTGPATVGGEEGKNYTVDYTGAQGQFNVDPATDRLVIIAQNKTKTYGTKDPALTYKAYLDGEEVDLEDLFEASDAADAFEIKMQRHTADTPNAAGTYIIEFPEQSSSTLAGVTTVTNPTQFGNFTATYEQGTFTITKATLYVKAKDQEIKFGAEPAPFELELFTTESGETGLVDGDSFETLLDEVIPEYTTTLTTDENGDPKVIKNEKFKNVVEYACEYNSEDPELQDYTITPVGPELKNYQVEYHDGTLHVVVADLTLTARPQTIHYANLVNNDTKSYATPSIKTAVTRDNIEITGKLPAGVTLDALVDHIECNTTAVGEHEKAIKLVPKANTNVNVTYVDGNLTITPLTEIHLAYENVGQALEDHKGKKMDKIYMPNRNLAPEKWSTFVLPFEVDVPELARQLYYGVADVLDPSASADEKDINFILEMGKIDANEPFIFKVAKYYFKGDENSTAFDDVADAQYYVEGEKQVYLSDIFFENKTIADGDFAYNDGDNSPFVESGNVMFIGTYTDKEGVETDEYFMAADGKFHKGSKWTTGENAKDYILKPTTAYLKLKDAAADVRIFIEEADGTVTEISEVDAEIAAEAAEGWYTITGVKLEGKPATKGTYIYNGKVVYVK